MMKIKNLFPEVRRIEPPPKERRRRRKSNRYTPKENRRRYRLHSKVKQVEGVGLKVRAREIVLPLGFAVDENPCIKELIYRFKYYAPTILK